MRSALLALIFFPLLGCELLFHPPDDSGSTGSMGSSGASVTSGSTAASSSSTSSGTTSSSSTSTTGSTGSSGSVSTEWATWPMPNDVSYTSNSETALDDVTGLLWERTPDAQARTQADAAAHCAGLSLAGHDDWRLPTEIELYSLIDVTVAEPGPMIDLGAFPGTPAGFVWSSTPVAGSPGRGWGVGFGNGMPSHEEASVLHGVRCVRSDATPGIGSAAHYSTHSSGVNASVTDRKTQLIWLRDAAQTRTADIAPLYCAALSTDLGPWRVPTVKELMTLVDFTVAPGGSGWMMDPVFYVGDHPSEPSIHWSSSSASEGTWYVDLRQGTAAVGAGDGQERVRCVQ